MVGIRGVRKMTQQQLADACGVHRAVIAGIEGGSRGIRLGEAVRICDALLVSLAEMVDAKPLSVHINVPID